jgi:hypothetical protein
MLVFLERLEAVVTRYSQPAQRLATYLLLLAGLIISGDFLLQLGGQLPPRLLRGVGKGLGEAAANLASLALAYYVLREVYVRLLKAGLAASQPWALPFLKSGLSVLRLLHPALGLAAVALAALHGYSMWLTWGGLQGGLPVGSGLVLAGAAGLLTGLGGGLLAFRQRLTIRAGHKWVALIALGLFAIHKLIVD